MAKKFRDTLKAEFTAKSLIDALTAYKLEAIEAMKAVRDQLEAER